MSLEAKALLAGFIAEKGGLVADRARITGCSFVTFVNEDMKLVCRRFGGSSAAARFVMTKPGITSPYLVCPPMPDTSMDLILLS